MMNFKQLSFLFATLLGSVAISAEWSRQDLIDYRDNVLSELKKLEADGVDLSTRKDLERDKRIAEIMADQVQNTDPKKFQHQEFGTLNYEQKDWTPIGKLSSQGLAQPISDEANPLALSPQLRSFWNYLVSSPNNGKSELSRLGDWADSDFIAVENKSRQEKAVEHYREFSPEWKRGVASVDSALRSLKIRSDSAINLTKKDEGVAFDPLEAMDKMQVIRSEIAELNRKVSALENLGAGAIANLDEYRKSLEALSLKVTTAEGRVKPYQDVEESFLLRKQMYHELSDVEKSFNAALQTGDLKVAKELQKKMIHVEQALNSVDTVIPDEMKELYESRPDFETFKYNVEHRLDDPPSSLALQKIEEAEALSNTKVVQKDVPVSEKNKEVASKSIKEKLADKMFPITVAAVGATSLVLYYREMIEGLRTGMTRLAFLMKSLTGESDAAKIRKIEKEISALQKTLRSQGKELARLESQEIKKMSAYARQLDSELSLLEKDLGLVEGRKGTFNDRLAKIWSSMNIESSETVIARMSNVFQKKGLIFEERIVGESFKFFDEIGPMRTEISQLTADLAKMDIGIEEELRLFRNNSRVVQNQFDAAVEISDSRRAALQAENSHIKNDPAHAVVDSKGATLQKDAVGVQVDLAQAKVKKVMAQAGVGLQNLWRRGVAAATKSDYVALEVSPTHDETIKELNKTAQDLSQARRTNNVNQLSRNNTHLDLLDDSVRDTALLDNLEELKDPYPVDSAGARSQALSVYADDFESLKSDHEKELARLTDEREALSQKLGKLQSEHDAKTSGAVESLNRSLKARQAEKAVALTAREPLASLGERSVVNPFHDEVLLEIDPRTGDYRALSSVQGGLNVRADTETRNARIAEISDARQRQSQTVGSAAIDQQRAAIVETRQQIASRQANLPETVRRANATSGYVVNPENLILNRTPRLFLDGNADLSVEHRFRPGIGQPMETFTEGVGSLFEGGMSEGRNADVPPANFNLARLAQAERPDIVRVRPSSAVVEGVGSEWEIRGIAAMRGDVPGIQDNQGCPTLFARFASLVKSRR